MVKLLVTGGKGLVGSEISSDVKVGKEFDLRDFNNSDKLISTYNPTHVIHCAGKVAGLGGNMNNMAQYYYDNLMINTNIIESCRKYKVDRLLVFSSTCVFPHDVSYPLTEDKIHLGPPHITNYGYAYAKRMADVQIMAYNQQYNTKYFSVIPCNMYGPNDNYNIDNSHVIPSLIHKVYLSIINNTNVYVWGSGKSLREFIYSKDVAKISEFLIHNYNSTKPIIISNSIEVSIEEIIITICDIFKFKNKIIFESNKPEGQFRKPSDNKYLMSIVKDFEFTPLRSGLEQTIEYFKKNYNDLRK